MIDNVNIEKINEVFVRVEAEPSIKMEMSTYFTFEVPGAKFMPAVRNKVWDGKVRLLNVMTGYIYAGLVPYIKKFCDQRGYECTVSKELGETEAVPEDFGHDLAKQVDAAFEVRDYQNDAIVHAIRHNRALFLSPTASGKSFIIYLIMAHHLMLERKILVIVPTTSLVDQMASDFVEYNKGKKLGIHKIRGGMEKDVDAEITISTWQSIYKMPKAFFEKFDVVFGDEAHNFKAKSLTSILEKMPHVKYRYGLTGTLDGAQCFDKNTMIETSVGKKKISEVKVGDLVHTVNEFTNEVEIKKVKNVFNNGIPTNKKMLRIKTSTGEFIVTESHHIMTDRGWVKAKDLNKNDKIVAIS